MGIDVYLRWDGQTEAERQAQITGYSTVHGHVGYLREAYHGEPYATDVLVAEAWHCRCPRDGDGSPGGCAKCLLPHALLAERLPEAERAAIERASSIYGEELGPDAPAVRSFRDFVALHGALERAGRRPRVHVSY